MSLLIIAGPLASGKTELIKRIAKVTERDIPGELVDVVQLTELPDRRLLDRLLAATTSNIIVELALDDDQTWPYTDVPIWRLRTPASRIGFRPDMIDKDDR